MGLSSPEYKKINLIPFPDGSLHNHPQGADELDDPESLKSRFDSFLNGEKNEEEKSAENVVYKDFSDVPKPTDNLEIDSQEKNIPTAAELAMQKTDKYVEKNQSEESGHFEVPAGLVSYIDELVSKGRPLRYLQLDLKESIKDQARWKKTLGDYHERAVIDEDEYNKAVSFLTKSSEKKDEDPKTAVDIAMEVTDKYVEKKEDNVAPKQEAPRDVSESVSTPDSSIETVEQKLEESRKNFAEQIILWEKQIKDKREVFQKLISGLGVTREVPEQEEPIDLVDAREAYKEAKKEKYKPLLEKNVTEMRSVEGQILPLREIKYETNTELADAVEKEQEKLTQAFESFMTKPEKEMMVVGLEKFGKVSRVARLMLSDMLASGTTLVFGQRAGEMARAYSGYRMERVVSGVAQKVDGIQKKNIENIHEDAVEELKTNIDEENLLEREQRFLKVLDKEKNLNKKRRLISAGISAITGTKKVEAQESSPDSSDSSESEAFLFNGKEIAHEKDGILVLDDEFQDGSEHKDARTAFAAAFDEKYKENLLGTTPIAIPFEAGKIYVIHGDEGIRVFLNGKEIAKGKDRRGVTLLKGIEKGWFLNSVYQRALEHAEPMIKTIK